MSIQGQCQLSSSVSCLSPSEGAPKGTGSKGESVDTQSPGWHSLAVSGAGTPDWQKGRRNRRTAARPRSTRPVPVGQNPFLPEVDGREVGVGGPARGRGAVQVVGADTSTPAGQQQRTLPQRAPRSPGSAPRAHSAFEWNALGAQSHPGSARTGPRKLLFRDSPKAVHGTNPESLHHGSRPEQFLGTRRATSAPDCHWQAHEPTGVRISCRGEHDWILGVPGRSLKPTCTPVPLPVLSPVYPSRFPALRCTNFDV